MRGVLMRRRALAVIAALVAVFAVFEVGVRLLPPDAVQYEIRTGINGGKITTTTGVMTDSATVARWRAALLAEPSGQSLLDFYVAKWQGRDMCRRLGLYSATYRFTWHGMPVEVVSPAPAPNCGGKGVYQVSSGGVPDWNTYVVDPLPQPAAAP